MQIDQFMKTIRGLSDHTRRAYNITLCLLEEDLDGEEPNPNDIQKFLNKYSPSSLHRHKAAIKAYWEFRFKGEEWPFNRRSFLAPRQRVPRYVNPNVIYKMIDATEDPDDSMFLRTLFMMGCRIQEIRDFDNEGITDAGVVVKVKGGMTKLKVFTKDFRDIFVRYAKKKRGRIFPRSYTYYNNLVKRLGKEVGVPKISLHMFRHSRAVDLLRKGMKLSEVQQFLGHANINTTAIYLQITGGELAEQLEKVEGNGKQPADIMAAVRELLHTDPDLKKELRQLLREQGAK